MARPLQNRFHRAWTILLVAFVVGGCATVPDSSDRPDAQPPSDERTDADAGKTQNWRVIAQGTQSAVRVPVARAVRDAGIWADAWAAIHANKSDPPARPVVDLNVETIVLILLGQRPTGGYDVSVASVDTRAGSVAVTVAVSSPGEDAMVTQALTSPYVIVAIPANEREVVFTGDDINSGYIGE